MRTLQFISLLSGYMYYTLRKHLTKDTTTITCGISTETETIQFVSSGT
jgi:hypothetical protein